MHLWHDAPLKKQYRNKKKYEVYRQLGSELHERKANTQLILHPFY